jgi:hypothetical protein
MNAGSYHVEPECASIAWSISLPVASRATATTISPARSANPSMDATGAQPFPVVLASECISRSRTVIAAYVHRVLQKSVTQSGSRAQLCFYRDVAETISALRACEASP